MSQLSADDALRRAIEFHQAGRLADAEALYRQVLAAQPGRGDALHFLGVLVGQTGRVGEAINLIRRAIAAGGAAVPAAYYANLGKFLLDADQPNESATASRRALELKPGFLEAEFNLGNALLASGDLDAAAAVFAQVVHSKPAFAPAHKNRGMALQRLGQTDDAVAAFRETVRLDPQSAESFNLLGVALRETGDLNGSLAAFREALRLKPGFAEARINTGNALQAAGRLDEAAACYREVLHAKPDFAEAHNNLASVLKEQGLVDDAVAHYRKAVALKPQSPAIHSNLLLALNYQSGSTRQSLFREARAWAHRHADPLATEIKPHNNAPGPDRRLRIGYVTADFRTHASAFFLLPLLENHDPARVEIICYSDVPRPDDITRRCQRAAHLWRDSARWNDPTLTQAIRDDAIDILVDLKLHADQNRLPVFARKPAPVQATWLGYPGTTGLTTIDYRLSDPHLDPSPDDDQFCSEQTIRLPETFWCYDPLSTEPVGGLPAERAKVITFGCLNHFSKVNDELIALWSRVLVATPDSRLTLLAAEGSHQQRTLDLFAAHRVSRRQIQFAAPRPRVDYLRLYHGIDIALDSWPVNGHTTTFDALWMGVPVITLAGPTALGRAGISQLTNLALPELIAGSPEGYAAIAARLAADLPRLAEMRASLRRRMERSPLMNGKKFAQHMEAAFRAMWQKWESKSQRT